MKNFLCLLALVLSSCSTLKNIGVEGVKPERKTFHPVWISNQDPVYNSGNLPISLQAPTIDRGLLFIGDENGKMKARQLHDGRLIWSIQDKGAQQAGALVIDDDIIYGTIEGRLYRRNRLSGKLVYEVDLGAAIQSTPIFSHNRLFLHTRNHQVFSLDAKTGKILWGYKRSVPYLTTIQGVSSPFVYKGKVYVGFADGNLVAISLEEGVMIWESKIINGPKFIDVDTGPILFNGKIFVGSLSNQMAMVNPDTGFLERRFTYIMTSKPLVHRNQLIFGTSDGDIVFLGTDFREKSKINVGEHQITSLKRWKNGYAAATSNGKIFKLDFSDQWFIKDTWHLGHAFSTVFEEMDTEQDFLAVYSSRNRLYLFN